MSSFAALDALECANPRGLVRFGNPLPAKLLSKLCGGNEITEGQSPLSVFILDMNHSAPEFETRHSLQKLWHIATPNPVPTAENVPAFASLATETANIVKSHSGLWKTAVRS